LHHKVFLGRVFPDVCQPSVPFWGNLRSVVFVLSIVNPSVAAWYLVLRVKVLKVSVSEMVSSLESTVFCVSDVLHVTPPLPKA